jgi:glycosyltransferase involved in cell wall biosynthesis
MIVPHNRFDSMWLEKLNVSVYRRALMERVLRRMKDDEESVAVVQNPFWAGALDADDFSRIYYDCMDEISLYAGKSSLDRFQRYEERLVGMSKGIFVTARKSEERLRSRYPGIPIYRIPNGVDAGWFEARTKESGVPPDVSAIRKPLVGYVGALYTWLDYELISEVAAALPEISFVFVGPIGDRKRVTGICANTNIHFLGRKGYDQVPLYIDAFNACIIPFKPGPISQATNPVKLFEYFALGKPVVSTALSELEPYAEDKLVYMTGERAEFASLVRTALSEADKTLAAKRKQVARENSWRAHAERMYAVFVRDGQESGPHHV